MSQPYETVARKPRVFLTLLGLMAFATLWYWLMWPE